MRLLVCAMQPLASTVVHTFLSTTAYGRSGIYGIHLVADAYMAGVSANGEQLKPLPDMWRFDWLPTCLGHLSLLKIYTLDPPATMADNEYASAAPQPGYNPNASLQ